MLIMMTVDFVLSCTWTAQVIDEYIDITLNVTLHTTIENDVEIITNIIINDSMINKYEAYHYEVDVLRLTSATLY